MKFYILFLVTRNAKKAKKKDDADQNPEYETPETDSEKEGATSTSTSDTEDEEEEAKSNTTSVKHNTKSITTRCVKNFYTNFFNNHKYIFLKIRKIHFLFYDFLFYDFLFLFSGLM